MYSIFTFSEAGGHLVNEDAFEVRYHPADEGCWLCALADGQGGQAGGDRAAQLASRTATEVALRYPPSRVADCAAWAAILRRADESVSADPDAGFTTLVGLCVAGGKLYGASSGDSAVVAIHAEGRTEELTSSQVKNPPVGSGGAVFVPFATKLVSPWAVLVMSDGVWKYVGWDRLKEIGTRVRGQALVDSLQEQARLSKTGRFQDDFTLVVVQDMN